MNDTDIIMEPRGTTDIVPLSGGVDTTTTLGLKHLIIDKYINGLGDDELVDKYAISRSTVFRRLASEDAVELRYKLTPVLFKRKITSQWHDIFDKAVPVVQDKLDKVVAGDKASLSELGTLLGITTDKIQLLTGQATEIHGYEDMVGSLAEIQAQKAQLKQELGFDPDGDDVVDSDVVDNEG